MCQDCSMDDLLIRQTPSGGKVEAKPEFEVSVLNECPCLQGNIILACNGFQSVKHIDPLVLVKSGNECLLNNGSSLGPFGMQTFSYAWDSLFPFDPVSSKIDCH
ncbi:hypothetical protein CFOL_v3_04078 [Cephalotus follicularis]|uniref:Uncharacterized protein n=1 Tax=Cephalotus follicularis TaxID=3775 RepID=A0A1Q3AXW7_CEPFO|nr:hypothetical protein CFOL_v3_04078 [Cephalotus follicularis]